MRVQRNFFARPRFNPFKAGAREGDRSHFVKTKIGKMKSAGLFAGVVALCFGTACGSSADATDATGSEVSTSVVSGALNNSTDTTLGWNAPTFEKRSILERVWDGINLIQPAWAASWTCTGGTLTPTFSGPGSYTYTPRSCNVSWRGGKTGSSSWTGTFDLAYGASCDQSHARVEDQAAGCNRDAHHNG